MFKDTVASIHEPTLFATIFADVCVLVRAFGIIYRNNWVNLHQVLWAQLEN